MADRVFDRAFERAASQQKRAEAKVEAERPLTPQEVEARENERLRNETAPMSSSDAIRRMLLASKDKDYFRVMGLEPPGINALGEATWEYKTSDVSRAYRKLSPLVHPDKNPSSDARKAFEALNEAYKALKDPGKLSEAMNSQLEAARKRQDAADSAATPSERAGLYAVKRDEKRTLQRQEAEKYKAEVLAQRNRLKERARQKREAEQRVNAKRKREESDLNDEDSDIEAAPRQKNEKPAVKRRSRPKLIF